MDSWTKTFQLQSFQFEISNCPSQLNISPRSEFADTDIKIFEIADTDADMDMKLFEIADTDADRDMQLFDTADTDMQLFDTADTDADTDMNSFIIKFLF